jgi:hypothetical protein
MSWEILLAMSWEIPLAIAAALVAIFGIVYDPKEAKISVTVVKRICDLRDWSLDLAIPRGLVFLALIICGFAILKSANDERDKKFMKAAITGTLAATPHVINEIYLQMNQVAKDRYTVLDYSNVSDGMVIFLRRLDKTGSSGPTESIVLSTSELAEIRASLILKEDPSPLLRRVLEQNFSFTNYNEDLYARLCALFSVSGRQVLFKKPVDCDYDSERGITLTVNVNNLEQQVILSVDEIKQYNDREAKAAFGAMNELLRAKVGAIVRPASDGVPQRSATPQWP